MQAKEEYNEEYYIQAKLHADPQRKDAQAILKLVAPNEGDNILDVGCGLGHYCSLFSQYGSTVTGIDISSYAIDKAKEFYCKNPLLRFICQDALKINYYNTFDKVLCSHTVEHLTKPEREILFNRIHLSLKSHGSLVLALPLFESDFPRLIASQLTGGKRGTDPHHKSQFTFNGLLDEVVAARFFVTNSLLLSTLKSLKMPLPLAKIPLMRSILIGAVDIRAIKNE